MPRFANFVRCRHRTYDRNQGKHRPYAFPERFKPPKSVQQIPAVGHRADAINALARTIPVPNCCHRPRGRADQTIPSQDTEDLRAVSAHPQLRITDLGRWTPLAGRVVPAIEVIILQTLTFRIGVDANQPRRAGHSGGRRYEPEYEYKRGGGKSYRDSQNRLHSGFLTLRAHNPFFGSFMLTFGDDVLSNSIRTDPRRLEHLSPRPDRVEQLDISAGRSQAQSTTRPSFPSGLPECRYGGFD